MPLTTLTRDQLREAFQQIINRDATVMGLLAVCPAGPPIEVCHEIRNADLANWRLGRLESAPPLMRAAWRRAEAALQAQYRLEVPHLGASASSIP